MVEAEDERLVEAIVSDLCSILKGAFLSVNRGLMGIYGGA